MDVVYIDTTMRTQQMPETGAIQDRARPDDSVSPAPRTLQSDVGHYVHGVGDNDHHPSRLLLDDFANDALHDGSVLLEKLKPRFARSLGCARRDHDDLRVRIVRRTSVTNGHGGKEWLPVSKVQRLSQGQVFVLIDEYDFVGQPTLRKSVCKRRSHSSRTDYDDLPLVPSCHESLLAEYPEYPLSSLFSA
jgi:hypothetical protein